MKQVKNYLTLGHPLRRKLRMSLFFDVSKMKDSSFSKAAFYKASDECTQLRSFLRIGCRAGKPIGRVRVKFDLISALMTQQVKRVQKRDRSLWCISGRVILAAALLTQEVFPFL